MQKCIHFTNDKQMLINVPFSVLCHVQVCAMIQCQAVHRYHQYLYHQIKVTYAKSYICIEVQLHTYGSHLNQQKKPMAEHLKKKNHGSHLVNTRGGHLVFPNQPKKIPRQVFPMMNLSCKFGSSSYNILRDRKAFVKT